MNCNTLTRMIAVAALLALAIPVPLAAQTHPKSATQHHHYQVQQIPTLGGLQTYFIDAVNDVAVLNNRGSVSGGTANTLLSDPNSSDYWWTPDGTITHAYLWQNGSLTDLGALPGTNNSASTWISDRGNIAGYSENGQIDPSVPGLPQIGAVVWRDGEIIDLGTLPGGGYQSAALSVNDRGEAVGIATNLVPDSNSLFQYDLNLWGIPYAYQMRAFIWDRKNGMQDLGTLGTGTDAQTVRINDRGQVIGDSYTSSAPGSCYNVTTGAFLWDRTHGMVDLGSFGGTCTKAKDLNNRGQVVGASSVQGDLYQRAFLWQNGAISDLGGSLGGNNTGALVINENGASAGFAYLAGETTLHAALWTRIGHITDLGTIDGDPCSFADGINDNRQVVGNSSPSDCVNFDPSRGFLWENGSMVDLNTLIPPNAPLYVVYAFAINQRGEIAVDGVDANQIEQAAVLIPCDENHPGVEGCDYSLVDASAAAHERTAPVRQNPMTTAPRRPALHGPSNDVRRMLQPRLGPLSHIPRPITGSVGDQKTPIPHDSDSHLEDEIAIDDRAEVVGSFGSTSSRTATINSCPAIRCSLNHTQGSVCGVRLCAPAHVQAIWKGYDLTYKRVCFYGC